MARQNTALVLLEGETSTLLQPLPLRPLQGVSTYDEAWLQDVIFANAGSLPIGEIAPAFGPLIPICKELDTRIAGPADALFVNALGMPTLIECKLWRNPQARREVVGQIIDYARVLREWTYVDMQREVARARKEQGFNLAEYVGQRSGDAAFSEAVFCDNLGRNLKRGHILLLIVGDGIREGVEAIADYIQETAALHFVLGLVETAVYKLDSMRLIVQSRVLAKTSVIERTLVTMQDPTSLAYNPPEIDPPLQQQSADAPKPIDARQVWIHDFWAELLSKLTLDDADQPMANVLSKGTIFFSMPPRSGMWLACSVQSARVPRGVSLGMDTSPSAKAIADGLETSSTDIERQFEEAGVSVEIYRLENGRLVISAGTDLNALRVDSERERHLDWFRKTINAFVNVLRPRVKELRDSSETSRF